MDKNLPFEKVQPQGQIVPFFLRVWGIWSIYQEDTDWHVKPLTTVFALVLGAGFSEMDFTTKIDHLNNDHFDKQNMQKLEQEDMIFLPSTINLLVWINIFFFYHQSIPINERTVSVKWTDCESTVDCTSWAPNSSNQSTDSSEAPINLARRITEGTFLIPEPLACAMLLLPAVCHVWMIGHITTSEYLKVKEEMMNLTKDQIHNIVYIQPKACSHCMWNLPPILTNSL